MNALKLEMENLENQLLVNPGKDKVIEAEGKKYSRFCIKTDVITERDSLSQVVQQYAGPHLISGDVLFISEKAVACAQKRAIPLKDIRCRPLARLLSRFVFQSPYGIGLGIPETMEMAIRECGTLRILFAAFAAALTKPFGVKGLFYRVAGDKARSIDGPGHYVIPPYNEYVVLSPIDPNQVAKTLSKILNIPVLIVDINDLDGFILGQYPPDLNSQLYVKILRDNPLGQSREQTPIGIIRE